MLELLGKCISDVSVLRKLIFAAVFLPPDIPNLWTIALEFATAGTISQKCITPDVVKALMENIQTFNATAFDSDEKLFREIVTLDIPGKPLGVPLISNNTVCLLCGNSLCLRNDRHSSVVIYDDNRGAIPGSHFHKYCSDRSCCFTQFYGYYTKGEGRSIVFLNSDWHTLPYFVTSCETAFAMEFLRRLDMEILIGQLSFKQRAEIFNSVHTPSIADMGR